MMRITAPLGQNKITLVPEPSRLLLVEVRVAANNRAQRTNGKAMVAVVEHQGGWCYTDQDGELCSAPRGAEARLVLRMAIKQARGLAERRLGGYEMQREHELTVTLWADQTSVTDTGTWTYQALCDGFKEQNQLIHDMATSFGALLKLDA